MVTAPPLRVCSKCEYAAMLPCSTCGDLLCPAHIFFGALHVMCIGCLAHKAEVPDKEDEDAEEDRVQAELDNLGVADTIGAVLLGLSCMVICVCVAFLFVFDPAALVSVMVYPFRALDAFIVAFLSIDFGACLPKL